MAYVRFTSKSRCLTSLVTLTYHGRIDFNTRAREKFNLQSYKHCILYYDEKARKIGIEFTNNPEGEGVLLLKHASSGTLISGKRFLDYFDILPDKSTSYFVKQESDGFVGINLRKVHKRIHRHRKGKKDKVVESPSENTSEDANPTA